MSDPAFRLARSLDLSQLHFPGPPSVREGEQARRLSKRFDEAERFRNDVGEAGIFHRPMMSTPPRNENAKIGPEIDSVTVPSVDDDRVNRNIGQAIGSGSVDTGPVCASVA